MAVRYGPVHSVVADRLETVIAGRYQLTALLGSGGLGAVYAAKQLETGRDVAVKLLLPDRSHPPELRRRFLREARAAVRVVHPNIVQVLDLGSQDDGTAYLVLERVRGETLAGQLKRVGRLTLLESIERLMPVMDAIAAAHRQGIVHEDLKPADIFLSLHPSQGLVPKLLDFGVAKVMNALLAPSQGQAKGPSAYVAPEQLRGEAIGPRVDVWAMGAIWVRCLTGDVPFAGQSGAALSRLILAGRRTPILEQVKDLPPSVAEEIDRALSVRPADRFPDMSAFLSALVEAAGASGAEWTAEPTDPSQPGELAYELIGELDETDVPTDHSVPVQTVAKAEHLGGAALMQTMTLSLAEGAGLDVAEALGPREGHTREVSTQGDIKGGASIELSLGSMPGEAAWGSKALVTGMFALMASVASVTYWVLKEAPELPGDLTPLARAVEEREGAPAPVLSATSTTPALGAKIEETAAPPMEALEARVATREPPAAAAEPPPPAAEPPPPAAAPPPSAPEPAKKAARTPRPAPPPRKTESTGTTELFRDW